MGRVAIGRSLEQLSSAHTGETLLHTEIEVSCSILLQGVWPKSHGIYGLRKVDTKETDAMDWNTSDLYGITIHGIALG